MAIHKLNALHVSRLKTKGRHGDEGGLNHSIDDSEGKRKRWVFLFRYRPLSGLP